MTRGRRPEPLEKRAGKGNPGKRPLPKSAPERVTGEPVPPMWMDGHALVFWRKTAGVLAKRGQWSSDSEPSFTALCLCWGEWLELAEDIRSNGRFQRVRTKAGAEAEDSDEGAFMERVRPAVAAFQDADRRLKGWLTEFGLTDASRGKVTGTPPEGDGDEVLKRYGLN